MTKIMKKVIVISIIATVIIALFLRKSFRELFTQSSRYSTITVELINEESFKIPKEARKLFNQAHIYHMRGDYRKAISYYKKSIKKKPCAESHTFLGWVYSDLGKYEEAIEECEKAIKLDPDFGNPYNDIGVYLIKKGVIDEAIPYLKKAIETKRYCCYHYTYFNLGRVYFKKGRYDKAIDEFKKSLKIKPNYILPQVYLRKIYSMLEKT